MRHISNLAAKKKRRSSFSLMFVLVCCWKRGSGADTGWQAKYCVWRAERSITNTDGVTGEMEHSRHKTVEININ